MLMYFSLSLLYFMLYHATLDHVIRFNFIRTFQLVLLSLFFFKWHWNENCAIKITHEIIDIALHVVAYYNFSLSIS